MCSHLNVGFGSDISIKDLAHIISDTVGFKGNIKFDASKEDGTMRKLMDSSKINALGWKPKINLEDGIKLAYEDFKLNQKVKELTMEAKTTLITGITGQDGSYLAEFLLEKGYIVHGIKRRSSLFNTDRVDHLYQDLHDKNTKFFLHFGDLSDASNITKIIKETMPDEIYNLGAQSHVGVSFDNPEYSQYRCLGSIENT